jgi:hypothetical protein
MVRRLMQVQDRKDHQQITKKSFACRIINKMILLDISTCLRNSTDILRNSPNLLNLNNQKNIFKNFHQAGKLVLCLRESCAILPQLASRESGISM